MTRIFRFVDSPTTFTFIHYSSVGCVQATFLIFPPACQIAFLLDRIQHQHGLVSPPCVSVSMWMMCRVRVAAVFEM